MRDYSNIVSDLTPGEFERGKAEYRISAEGFGDRVKLIKPTISDEDVDVLATEFAREYAGE